MEKQGRKQCEQRQFLGYECLSIERNAQEEDQELKGRCERSWAQLKNYKVEELKLYDFKNYETSVIKTLWQWHKDT